MALCDDVVEKHAKAMDKLPEKGCVLVTSVETLRWPKRLCFKEDASEFSLEPRNTVP